MSNYIPRLTAPTEDNRYYYADNPYFNSGFGLPNCTCYAFGRFFELTNILPRLSLRNAENWWAHEDGYARGQSPRLGAVACWRKGVAGDSTDGAGHVAVVEQINADGSFLTSNSGYSGTFFYLKTIPSSGELSGYVFQGFIYCPITTHPAPPPWLLFKIGGYKK